MGWGMARRGVGEMAGEKLICRRPLNEPRPEVKLPTTGFPLAGPFWFVSWIQFNGAIVHGSIPSMGASAPVMAEEGE